jgi:hypothetical protein
MGLTTGTPLGSVISQEDMYIEGAPYLYVQDYAATPLNNPDVSGYYWGLSGTAAAPVYSIGCVVDVSLTEGVTMNDVRCDAVGSKDTIQRRDYVEFNLTVQSLFPLSVLAKLMNLSTATVSTGLEKVGIGSINNQKKYHVYAPKVYDADTGDYLLFHLHKAKFVDAWTIDFRQGEAWQMTGVKLRAYADDTKPDTQLFGVIVRSDLSAIP